MTATERTLEAIVVRCGERWVIEVPSLMLRVAAHDLANVESDVADALTKRRGRLVPPLRIQVVSYLHVDDLPESSRRAAWRTADSLRPETKPA
jgi:hypothetical protein